MKCFPVIIDQEMSRLLRNIAKEQYDYYELHYSSTIGKLSE